MPKVGDIVHYQPTPFAYGQAAMVVSIQPLWNDDKPGKVNLQVFYYDGRIEFVENVKYSSYRQDKCWNWSPKENE